MYKSYRDDRGGSSRGGRSFGGGRGGSRGGSSDGMHDAICAMCSSPCQVPFRPYPGKSIFCNNCFKKDESAGGKFDRPSYGGKKPFNKFGGRSDMGSGKIEVRLEAIEQKLDALIEALMAEAEDEAEDEDEDGEEK